MRGVREHVTVASPSVHGASAGGARRALAGSALALAASVLAASCGGGHGHASTPTTVDPGPSPRALLDRTARVLDATRAVHFELLSSGLPPKTTVMVSGHGDLARPADVAGSLLVGASGATATIKVIAANGKFYVELPLTPRYTTAKPATYGLGNPAVLLSRTRGLTSLLAHLLVPAIHGSLHVDGEQLELIAGTVPGTQVPFLTDRDRNQPVTVTAEIATRSWQLRRVVLSGPFAKPRTTTTYTIELTDYGEHVRVAPPPA